MARRQGTYTMYDEYGDRVGYNGRTDRATYYAGMDETVEVGTRVNMGTNGEWEVTRMTATRMYMRRVEQAA